jgi:hypothetical protein
LLHPCTPVVRATVAQNGARRGADGSIGGTATDAVGLMVANKSKDVFFFSLGIRGNRKRRAPLNRPSNTQLARRNAAKCR